MPLYKCEWPNGDVSIVLASDVSDAIAQLDEFGAAEPKMIKRLSTFMIDLKPNRQLLEANERARKKGTAEEHWPWELHEVGECLMGSESTVLPSEETTLRRIRKFASEEQSAESERELRQRAVRDGTIIDLAARRLASATRRKPSTRETETHDDR